MVSAGHFETKFFYEGQEYTIWITAMVGFGRNSFSVNLARYSLGSLRKDENYWLPLELRINYQNFPFELQAHDFQIIGEMIEDNFDPELID